MWWEDKAGMKWKFWAAWVTCFTSFTSPLCVLTRTDVSSCQLWVADNHDTSARSLRVELRRSNVNVLKKKKKQSSSRFAPTTHEGQSGKTCHSCYSWNWVCESNLKWSVTAFISMPHYGKWSPLCCQAKLILTTVRQPPIGGESELREPKLRTARVRRKKSNI